jgi:hypothetical protein
VIVVVVAAVVVAGVVVIGVSVVDDILVNKSCKSGKRSVSEKAC